MRTSRLLALAVTTAVLGSSAGAVHAAPSESQRLRGMEGRSFAVTVTGLPDGPFENCYEFGARGIWTDAALEGIPGSWKQDRIGASTTYTAEIEAFFGLTQTGSVTPAGGSGVLQLHATTEIPGLGLRAVSTGYEVDKCPPSDD